MLLKEINTSKLLSIYLPAIQDTTAKEPWFIQLSLVRVKPQFLKVRSDPGQEILVIPRVTLGLPKSKISIKKEYKGVPIIIRIIKEQSVNLKHTY